MKKQLKYSQHQRDYTLTGTSVIWDELMGTKLIQFFHYRPNPCFVMVEDEILYHFHAETDAIKRSKNWLENNNINSLKIEKLAHDNNLKNYRKFIISKYNNPTEALKKLYYYYRILLPIPLLVIELPEHLGDKIGEEMYELCMKARRENEDLYKAGTEFEKMIIADLEYGEKMPKDSLKYLTSFEIEQYFASNKLPKDIEKRKKFILLKHSNGKVEKYFDKKYLYEFNLVEDIDENIKEIKGQVAYQGKVRGKVKILRKVEDIKDFHEGDILVASMTDPRYVPAMKKAGAIITDEGGVTCHAAIVSRELKKPCVMATKIASRVLKDGDEVEVDAERGEIRKI